MPNTVFRNTSCRRDEPLSDSERQSYWQAFVRRHLPHFRLSPIDQLETYVAPTWKAIVDTAINAEAPLRQLLARLKPDAVVLDNVIMFPAIASRRLPVGARRLLRRDRTARRATCRPICPGLAPDDPQTRGHSRRAISRPSAAGA